MIARMGEQLVGAYLKVIERCDFVGYNMRPPGGGLGGLEELDVVGLRFADKTAILCEVTTHIGGLLYTNNPTTVKKIAQKFERQKAYANQQLKNFLKRYFQFWSPNVPVGYLTENLAKMGPELELVINHEYARRIDALRHEASKRKNDEGNDAFRLLQILEHLRRPKPGAAGTPAKPKGP